MSIWCLQSRICKNHAHSCQPAALYVQATPVPNIPLYFAGYKVYSASKALGGCSALRMMWAQTDTQRLTALREELLQLQEAGVSFPAGSWPQRLIRQEARYVFASSLAVDRLQLSCPAVPHVRCTG